MGRFLDALDGVPVAAGAERILRQPTALRDIPRPKRERTLPAVLGRDEVRRLLDAVDNPTHRALLMLVYSAGLRVGEAVRLRPGDLDPGRRRAQGGSRLGDSVG